ncbi:unnamed protein product [Cochlearia groenlandica]
MAGNNDPNTNPPGDDNNNNKEDDPYYDAHEEFGHFTDQELHDIMSDFNPNLSDLSITPPNIPQAAVVTHDHHHHRIVAIQEPTMTMIPDVINNNTNDIDDMFTEDEMTLLCGMFNVTNPNNNNNNNNDHIIGSDYTNVVGNNNDNVIGDDTNVDVVGDNNVVVVGSSRLEVSTRVFGVRDLDLNGGSSSSRPINLTVTPPTTHGIFVCTCCNPVRRIVHANGREMMTLDVHGANGTFCHAILETRRFDINERTHQTIHLSGLSNEDVARFLESFHEWCVNCGVPLAHDSNSYVYGPMYNGPNLPVQQQVNLPMDLDMPHVGLGDEPKSKGKGKKLTPLAIQRARTQEMKLKGLTEMHFRLPIVEASKLLGVCPTVVKKMCRKGNLPRWPHRKIKSLERRITTLQGLLLRVKKPMARARLEEEIESLRKEISDICSEILKKAADQ